MLFDGLRAMFTQSSSVDVVEEVKDLVRFVDASFFHVKCSSNMATDLLVKEGWMCQLFCVFWSPTSVIPKLTRKKEKEKKRI